MIHGTSLGGPLPALIGFGRPPRRLLTSTRYAPLAQLAEQRTLNPRVQGSSPWRRTLHTINDLSVP
jgi:hypothetical protein